jgi:general secretion pathway protein H
MRTAMSQTGPSGDVGFTLLEVLIALAVLSLAAVTIAGIAPQASDRAELMRTLARLDDAFGSARAEAIRTGGPTALVFDPLGHRFRQAKSTDWQAISPSVALNITSARELGSATMPVVAFLADGTTTGAEIVLETGGMAVVRRIGWLTGSRYDHAPQR